MNWYFYFILDGLFEKYIIYEFEQAIEEPAFSMYEIEKNVFIEELPMQSIKIYGGFNIPITIHHNSSNFGVKLKQQTQTDLESIKSTNPYDLTKPLSGLVHFAPSDSGLLKVTPVTIQNKNSNVNGLISVPKIALCTSTVLKAAPVTIQDKIIINDGLVGVPKIASNASEAIKADSKTIQNQSAINDGLIPASKSAPTNSEPLKAPAVTIQVQITKDDGLICAPKSGPSKTDALKVAPVTIQDQISNDDGLIGAPKSRPNETEALKVKPVTIEDDSTIESRQACIQGALVGLKVPEVPVETPDFIDDVLNHMTKYLEIKEVYKNNPEKWITLLEEAQTGKLSLEKSQLVHEVNNDNISESLKNFTCSTLDKSISADDLAEIIFDETLFSKDYRNLIITEILNEPNWAQIGKEAYSLNDEELIGSEKDIFSEFLQIKFSNQSICEMTDEIYETLEDYDLNTLDQDIVELAKHCKGGEIFNDIVLMPTIDKINYYEFIKDIIPRMLKDGYEDGNLDIHAVELAEQLENRFSNMQGNRTNFDPNEIDVDPYDTTTELSLTDRFNALMDYASKILGFDVYENQDSIAEESADDMPSYLQVDWQDNSLVDTMSDIDAQHNSFLDNLTERFNNLTHYFTSTTADGESDLGNEDIHMFDFDDYNAEVDSYSDLHSPDNFNNEYEKKINFELSNDDLYLPFENFYAPQESHHVDPGLLLDSDNCNPVNLNGDSTIFMDDVLIDYLDSNENIEILNQENQEQDIISDENIEQEPSADFNSLDGYEFYSQDNSCDQISAEIVDASVTW